MSGVSVLHQALEDPRYRVAEDAMARWLAAPDLEALDRALPALSLDRARKLGITLEGAALLGLVPRSPAVSSTVATLARKTHARQAATLQERWGVSPLPFDFGRLKQRLREAAAAESPDRPGKV